VSIRRQADTWAGAPTKSVGEVWCSRAGCGVQDVAHARQRLLVLSPDQPQAEVREWDVELDQGAGVEAVGDRELG